VVFGGENFAHRSFDMEAFLSGNKFYTDLEKLDKTFCLRNKLESAISLSTSCSTEQKI